MDYDFAMELARELIRRLQGHGNFEEFASSCEDCGIDEGCVQIIADGLVGKYDKEVEVRLRLEKWKKKHCGVSE